MIIYGKVIASWQHEDGEKFIRIKFDGPERGANRIPLSRIIDIEDNGELSIGNLLTIQILGWGSPESVGPMEYNGVTEIDRELKCKPMTPGTPAIDGCIIPQIRKIESEE